MAYHINEEFSDLYFEVVNNDEVYIKVKAGAGGGGSGETIYLIKVGELTKPSDKNAFSALRTLEELKNCISSIEDDEAQGLITFHQGIVTDSVTSKNFSTGVLGTGFKIGRDPITGQSFAEIDKLLVRMQAVFQQLSVAETEIAGYNMVLNAGAKMTCTGVETHEETELYFVDDTEVYYYDNWRAYADVFIRCFFLSDDGEKAIENPFKFGDFARSQNFNLKEGVYEGVQNHYYWRKVVGVGDDYIDLARKQCDEGSTLPMVGDVIVQMGHESDTSRQNMIVMSAYGEGAPYLTFYSGVNSYSLEGKDCFSIGYDRATNEPYLKNYGRVDIALRDNSSYFSVDTARNKIKLKAEVEIIGGFNEDLAHIIGYAGGWGEMIEAAAQEKTLIIGGYINTKLIQAHSITADMIETEALNVTSTLIANAIKAEGLNVNDKFIVGSDGRFTATEADISGKITADSGEFNNGTISNCVFNSLRSKDSEFVYDDNGLRLIGELRTGSAGEYVIVGKGGSADIRQYDGLDREVANLAVYQESNYQTARSRLILNQWSQGDGSIPYLTCELKPGELFITDKNNNTASYGKDFISFKDSSGEYYGQSGSMDVVTDVGLDFNGNVSYVNKKKIYFKGGIIYGAS